MALLMEAGAEPQTENERADLEAISALKESTAIEFKENGNEYVKMGKKHYHQAAECYTKAIHQNALDEKETSKLFSNRAHVNLLLGNNRRALEDAKQAIKLCPTSIKGYYRAAKAELALNLLEEAKSTCDNGVKLSPENEDLKKLARQVNVKLMEKERREAEISKALGAVKELVCAFESRGLRMGKAMYRELSGLKRPYLDDSGILHWPVLLLYAEVMSSDFIEDFCEIDMFSSHLDMMFSKDSPPLAWDKENVYTRDAIEVYYEASSSMPCLSRMEIMRYLVEGTPAAGAESLDEEKESSQSRHIAGGETKWVRVNQRRTLHDVMQEKDFVILGIPVFYIVSKRSSFYKDFKSGKWSLPYPHSQGRD